MRCAVRRPVSAYLASACLAAGCVTSHPAAPSEACVPTARTTRIQLNGIDRIDLLFVIDDSASMAEEQAALASALPEMIAMLTSGDLDRDGDSFDRGDFPGLRELNVGVITTNMGSGGHAVPTCDEPELGDDGLMRTEGAPGCAASYARFYRFGDDAGALARGAACVVAPGTRGCGIEQPLEAVLKALSPSSAQPWTSDRFVPVGDPSAPGALREPFFGGTPPHGDREHAGFVGEDGLLVVVAITDEDDCSIRDPELFDPESRRYTAPLALRCSASPDALHPIERYVEGLLQLRPRPSQLVFAPIVGVPPDLVPTLGDDPDWTALASPDCDTPLRDPRLCERLLEDRLAPSCSTATGAAAPPRRILELARELDARGARVVLQSICQESYEDALAAIVRAIFRSPLSADCAPYEVQLGPDGSASCDLRFVLPHGVECAEEGWPPALDDRGEPVREDGRAVCVVPQLVPASRLVGAPRPSGSGWFYDNFTTESARPCGPRADVPGIEIVGAPPPAGTIAELACEVPGLVAPCAPGGPDPCPGLAGTRPVACDPIARSCGLTCETDADCRRAGHALVCDTTPLGALDPARFPGDERPRGFCVRATCR